MVEMISRTLHRFLTSCSAFLSGTLIGKLADGLAAEPARISEMRDKVLCAAVPNAALCPEAIYDLENKYGIPHDDTRTDAQRIAAIVQRASRDGAGGPDWLELQIQAAGFPLYVVENTPRIDTRIKKPEMFLEASTFPEFPDNVAGRVYWQDDWATTDGWTASSYGSLSVSDGILTDTLNSTTVFLLRAFTSFTGKLIRIKVKISASGSIGLSGTVDGAPNTSIIVPTAREPGEWFYLDVYVPGSVTALYINGTCASGAAVTLDAVYIGSGLYDTKVPDITGTNVVTSYGVMPIDAGNGRKAFSFLGNQYMVADNSVVGIAGTIACKIKRSASSGAIEIVMGNYSASPIDGFNVIITPANELKFNVYVGGSVICSIPIKTDFTDADWHKIHVVFNGSIVTPVFDGVFGSSFACTTVFGSGFLTIGKNPATSSNFFSGLLADPVYDSRIWTQEDVDWYNTHDGYWNLTGYVQYGDRQFDETTQFSVMPKRVDPATVGGVLIVSPANKRGGARTASSAQFGTGQFGSSQFGTPDSSKSYPQPASFTIPTDPLTWNRVFFLSPFADRLASFDEMLLLSDDQIKELTQLVMQIKFLRNWCIAQVATDVQRITDDGSTRVLEDGTTIRRI